MAMVAMTAWGHSLLLANPFWRARVHGRERVRGGPYVICSNHQSAADIFVLSVLHGHWKFIAKSSLFWIPIFGWGMRAIGNIPVDRARPSSARRMIELCHRWLERGVSVLIFPEGTRSTDGELLPFKDGAFSIAIASGRPVLPVVIDGTIRAFRKGAFDLTSRADILVSVLPPIDAAPYREKKDVSGLRDATRDAMVRELERLRDPSPG
jgi:1-acyl-sn-glycerol-3-phosphate acyltransferase